MAELTDRGVSFTPYFDIPAERMDAFHALVERFIDTTRQESGCLYYGFCFDGQKAICREAYADGDAFLVHLDNVGELFAEAQQIADVYRMELAGPAAELAKLEGPLADLDIQYFTLEAGFRN